IYNGVDTERFAPREDGPPVLPPGFAPPDALMLGTMGRLDPLKNQLALAEAFARLVQQEPALRARLRLVIVGDGGERDKIEAVLQSADARALAWLPGFRDDTPALYNALDLFVLPSL